VLAVGVVVAAVVISKRRSASIAPAEESQTDREPEQISS
jgi:K(+)-stimulated pyrophosphate-energized sodium pump